MKMSYSILFAGCFIFWRNRNVKLSLAFISFMGWSASCVCAVLKIVSKASERGARVSWIPTIHCIHICVAINCFGYKYDSSGVSKCHLNESTETMNSGITKFTLREKEKRPWSMRLLCNKMKRNCDSHRTFFCCTIIHWCDNCYSSSFFNATNSAYF